MPAQLSITRSISMSQPPSQSYKGAENTSTITGANGGIPEPSESQNPTTLPPNFTLRNTKEDAKGHEDQIPNSELSFTDGRTTGPTAVRGDEVKQYLQSHDISIPPLDEGPAGRGIESNETGPGAATNTAGYGQGGVHTRSEGINPQ